MKEDGFFSTARGIRGRLPLFRGEVGGVSNHKSPKEIGQTQGRKEETILEVGRGAAASFNMSAKPEGCPALPLGES